MAARLSTSNSWSCQAFGSRSDATFNGASLTRDLLMLNRLPATRVPGDPGLEPGETRDPGCSRCKEPGSRIGTPPLRGGACPGHVLMQRVSNSDNHALVLS